MYHEESLKDEPTALLIGVCHVDITALVQVSGMDVVEGYYRLTRSGNKLASQFEGESVGDEVGYVKVKVTVLQNLKRLISDIDIRELQPVNIDPIQHEETVYPVPMIEDVFRTLRTIRDDSVLHPQQSPHFHTSLNTKERTASKAQTSGYANMEMMKQNQSLGESNYSKRPVESDAIMSNRSLRETKAAAEYQKQAQRLVAEVAAAGPTSLRERHEQNLRDLDLINQRYNQLLSFRALSPGPRPIDDFSRRNDLVPAVEGPEEDKDFEKVPVFCFVPPTQTKLPTSSRPQQHFATKEHPVTGLGQGSLAQRASEVSKRTTNVFQHNLLNLPPSPSHLPVPSELLSSGSAAGYSGSQAPSMADIRPPYRQPLSSTVGPPSQNSTSERVMQTLKP